VTWTFAGATAVALLTGTSLALVSGAERDARRFDRADDLGMASRVSFGAALGLAAGAMLAYVLEADGAPSERAPHAIATKRVSSGSGTAAALRGGASFAWRPASLTLVKSR
jgi:hypothetical protein